MPVLIFRWRQNVDLREFYRSVQTIEAGIVENDVVVVSLATSDGGRAGVMTEVPRGVAARYVAERRSRLATAEEASAYYAEMEREKRRLRPSLHRMPGGQAVQVVAKDSDGEARG